MATLTISHSFTGGTDATASEVNTNFTEVTNFVNASVLHADGAVSASGQLTLSAGDPTASAHAARKLYVDTGDAASIVSARGRDYQRVSMVAGNITLNSTTAVIVPGATTLTIAAAAGDLILITAGGQFGNAAVSAEIDFKTASTYAFNSAFATASQAGHPSWKCTGAGYQVFGGSFLYAVVGGDISGGNATFIPYYRTGTASALTLYAGSTTSAPPFYYSAVNLGVGT